MLFIYQLHISQNQPSQKQCQKTGGVSYSFPQLQAWERSDQGQCLPLKSQRGDAGGRCLGWTVMRCMTSRGSTQCRGRGHGRQMHGSRSSDAEGKASELSGRSGWRAQDE